MADAGRQVSERDGRWTLEIRRRFAAPLAQVYRALSDPARLAAWFGPDGYDATVESFDFRVGGRWRVVLHGPDGERRPVGGRFSAIAEGRRLSLTWAWDTPDATGVETLVTFSFASVDGGTELHLVHSGFTTEENAEAHGGGWTSSLDRLALLLAAG